MTFHQAWSRSLTCSRVLPVSCWARLCSPSSSHDLSLPASRVGTATHSSHYPCSAPALPSSLDGTVMASPALCATCVRTVSRSRGWGEDGGGVVAAHAE